MNKPRLCQNKSVVPTTSNLLNRKLSTLFNKMDLFLYQVKFLEVSIFIVENYFVSGNVEVFDFWANFLNFELDSVDVVILNFYRDPKVWIFWG